MVDHSNMKLGKLPVLPDSRAKAMHSLVSKYRLAAPPYWRVDWSKKLPASLGMMLNNRIGDCTCAALGHYIQSVTVWTQPQMVTVSDADVLTAYEAVSGYNPADPTTDVGAYITTALEYFRTVGIAGHKIDGWVTCQPGAIADLKNAIWLCGGCDIGIQLPITAQGQDVWSLVSTTGNGAPGSWGGHSVLVNEWDDHRQMVKLITWGQEKWATYRFWQYYADEGYGLVSRDWVMKSGLTPSDINYNDLLAYVTSGF